MAAAASESFSGRLDTEVTSIFIRASRSMSMTLVEEEAVGWSAALADTSKLNPAKSAAPAFHLFPCVRAGLFSAPRRTLDELFMMYSQLGRCFRSKPHLSRVIANRVVSPCFTASAEVSKSRLHLKGGM